MITLPQSGENIVDENKKVTRSWTKFFRSLITKIDYSIPSGSIINVYLTAQNIADNFDSTGLGNVNSYIGWAICNGSNGTPNLASKFIRYSIVESGATGGSDSQAAHSHTGPSHTHDINHDHASFNCGYESNHTHGASGLNARIAQSGSSIYSQNSSVSGWNADSKATSLTLSSNTTGMSTGVVVMGSTESGSQHRHAVDVPSLGKTNSGSEGTGSTSTLAATDNRPAFFELVPLMKI